APTPSAAAEIVIRAKAEICEQIDSGVRRIRHALERRVGSYRSELRHLASSDGIGRFPRRVRQHRDALQGDRVALYRVVEDRARRIRRRLDACREPLVRYPVRLDHAKRDLRAAMGRLQAVSPLSVLSRGYAIAFSLRRGRRKPIRDVTAVGIGERVEVQVQKGRFRCTVDERTLGVESLWPVPTEE
ncbi:MAG: exodeoxyribonuclease VII large subunit, partial [Thermoanaerobaculia bacterium]